MHIIFTYAGADELREALLLTHQQDVVISLEHDLNIGPIRPSDPVTRSAWMMRELDDEAYRMDAIDVPWDAVLVGDTVPTVWFSRRSASEYAGFLELLWRMGDALCNIIDLSETRVTSQSRNGEIRPSRLAVSQALMRADEIVRGNLFATARPLSLEERARYRSVWTRLRDENAPLRVLDCGELVSAPVSYFDALLLSIATPEWGKMALIVGYALAETWEDDIAQIGASFLAARIRALADMGQLELRGDISAMRTTEMRRAPSFGDPIGPA
jgi:Protein of unknown function/Domain of unknown function (DUF1835)